MNDDAGASALSTAILDIATRLAKQLGSPNTERRIAAISLIMALDRLTDRALHAIVHDARDAGFSWQQIGDITGTSRQGAAQRFGVDPGGALHDVAMEPIPDALPLATTIVTALLEDDREAFRRHMVKSMASALTNRRMDIHLRQITATFGTPEAIDHDGVEVSMLGDLTVVQIPVCFSGGDAVARVTFTPERQMLGVWIDPVPVQEGELDHG